MSRITVSQKPSKITVVTAPKNRIEINTSSGGGGGAGSAQTLRQLSDVDTTDLDNNETLVYDEASGMFIIKELPIINGGTF